MIAFVLYLGSIVAGNVAFAHLGVVPVGLGLSAPAAVYFVGLSLVLRDFVQERLGKRGAIAAMVLGAALSAIVSPELALASGAAFLMSETLDFLVYTPLRKHGRIRAILASGAAGIPLDSVIFLGLAFGSMAFLPGQMLGKAVATVAAAAFVWAVRKYRASRA